MYPQNIVTDQTKTFQSLLNSELYSIYNSCLMRLKKVNLLRIKCYSMYTEARKIQLISEVLKVSNEATLEELESVLKKKSLQHRKVKNPSIYDFVGVVSKKESEQMKQAIKDSCETIESNDWNF